MSFDPMPVQQHAFEEICAHLMSHIVFRQTQHYVRYTPLGRRGQSQWGVDLVTDHPKYAPVVGQCKHKQAGSVLGFTEVLQELRKTNQYPNSIERYFLFTTSARDSQLQTSLVGYQHTRPDGTQFPVRLLYWVDLHDLSFVPKDELRRFFPEQAHHARHFLPPPDMEAVVAAYEMAPSVLTHWFSEDNIQEIVSCPQTLRLSSTLWHKLNLFQQAVMSAKQLRSGVNSYAAARPCIRALFRTLPALDGFAHILHDFKKQYADLDGCDPHDLLMSQRCSELRDVANSVQNNYHRLIYGEMDMDAELADLKKSEMAPNSW